MVNAQALKLTRYTRKELINSPLSMLIAVECRSENPLLESLNKCNWQACRYKNLENFRHRQKRPDIPRRDNQ